MGKTIKVIDLLNKIANGNDMPLSFRYEGIDWVLQGGRYYQKINNEVELENWFEKWLFKSLNEELEIPEEDKEIEKLDTKKTTDFGAEYVRGNRNKINELVDAVNKLKKEGK